MLFDSLEFGPTSVFKLLKLNESTELFGQKAEFFSIKPVPEAVNRILLDSISPQLMRIQSIRTHSMRTQANAVQASGQVQSFSPSATN